MITKELELLRPSTTREALEILDDRGGDVTVLAGGMSLMPMMNLGIVKPGTVMSLNHVADLSEIVTDGVLRIGAMVTHRRLDRSDLVIEQAPMLAVAARSIGDVQVRNRGTVGGSVCHADPAADYLTVLAAYNASVELASSADVRVMSIHDFLIDVMYTAREDNELLTAVLVPIEADGTVSSYQRLTRVEGSYPIVSAAAVIEAGFATTRIALGGVGPAPVVVNASVVFSAGISDEAFSAMEALIEDATSMASADVHSSAEYRRAMASVFARRAVEQAADSWSDR